MITTGRYLKQKTYERQNDVQRTHEIRRTRKGVNKTKTKGPQNKNSQKKNFNRQQRYILIIYTLDVHTYDIPSVHSCVLGTTKEKETKDKRTPVLECDQSYIHVLYIFNKKVTFLPT